MKLHMLEKLSDLSGWMARKLHMLEKLKKLKSFWEMPGLHHVDARILRVFRVFRAYAGFVPCIH